MRQADLEIISETPRLCQADCGTAVSAVKTQARRLCHNSEIVSSLFKRIDKTCGGVLRLGECEVFSQLVDRIANALEMRMDA